MLDKFYKNQARWTSRFRTGPLAGCLDGYAAMLDERGYTRSCGHRHLGRVASLNQWMAKRGLEMVDLAPRTILKFLRTRPSYDRRARNGEETAVRLLLDHLHGIDSPARRTKTTQESPCLERDYAVFLEQERGLAPSTVRKLRGIARDFLSYRFGRRPIEPCRLQPKDAAGFVQHRMRQRGTVNAKGVSIALRSFLAFLHVTGAIEHDIARHVPRVPRWRLCTIPKYLEPRQVEAFLRSIPRRSPRGKRDYAVLMLLARLGLRVGEVVALTIDDVNWATGEITVRGKGGRVDRLPLSDEVGIALESYLNVRPRCSTRRLFIRHQAPRRGLTGSAGLSNMVGRALTRAGLKPAYGAAHVLRHSLATRMLRGGLSLADIAEILRHQLLDSTTIYAKVDFRALRTVVRPWPEVRR